MKKNDIVHRLDPEGIEVRAIVNWVVDDEMGISYQQPPHYKGGSNVVPTSEWVLLVEAAPSYQSTVASMSDTELQSAITGLRDLRRDVSMPRRGSGKKAKAVKSDPIADALAKMTPEKREALKKKLGIV